MRATAPRSPRAAASTPPSRSTSTRCGSGGGFSGPGTCTVKERFTPTALGAASGTTNVFECPIVGGTCVGIPYTDQGTGVSQASATPTSVNFGNVPLNTTATQTVTISCRCRLPHRGRLGQRSQRAVCVRLRHLRHRRWLLGARHLHRQGALHPNRARRGERHHQRVRVPDRRRHLYRDPVTQTRAPVSARQARPRPASASETSRSTRPRPRP